MEQYVVNVNLDLSTLELSVTLLLLDSITINQELQTQLDVYLVLIPTLLDRLLVSLYFTFHVVSRRHKMYSLR